MEKPPDNDETLHESDQNRNDSKKRNAEELHKDALKVYNISSYDKIGQFALDRIKPLNNHQITTMRQQKNAFFFAIADNLE